MAYTHQQLVALIHSAGHPFVLAATGGGSGAVAALLQAPGASASVLEVLVPYARAALEEFISGEVDQSCSDVAARAMAMVAWQRACKLHPGDATTVRGIGATCSLATNRPKRGTHRVHVAWQSATTTVVVSRELTKGQRDRAAEEQVASAMILAAIAEACEATEASDANGGLAQWSETAEVAADAVEPLVRREKRAPSAWTELLIGQRDHVAIGPQTVPTVLMPGAFNPFHQGHRKVAQLASERLGQPVTFELSITNVDKRPLDFVEIEARLTQFTDQPAWLTRAPTFVAKAELVPGCTFVVGADTITRIGDPHYYDDCADARNAAVAAIAGAGCRFLVFGRTVDGHFRELDDLCLPEPLRRLCDGVAEAAFRADISSTELRQRAMESSPRLDEDG